MTITISSRKLEVQLMVDHPHLKSVELEKILTLPADEHWDVGDVVPKWPERRYQFSRWAFCEVANSLDELPDVMKVLTERIRGIEQNFHLLPSNSKIGLTLFVTETDTVIGMGIDADSIKMLARINAGIEVSIVVTAPD